MTQDNDSKPDTKPRFDGLNIGLWVAQGVLAFMYIFAGWTKLTQPLEALLEMGWGWAANMPLSFIRFIGIAEIAGAIGLILPALLRIQPKLTPLAAMGLTLVQIAAIVLHASRGEFAVLPLNVVLLALSVFVVYGRTKKRVILPKNS